MAQKRGILMQALCVNSGILSPWEHADTESRNRQPGNCSLVGFTKPKRIVSADQGPGLQHVDKFKG